VFAPIPDPNPNLLVGLAISGGGSRAAVFGAGVLEALANMKINEAGGERSVLERVQYISSVSGGSLAAAYYAALKPPIIDEDFFRKFKAAMQEDFELPAAMRQVLFLRAFNPTKFAYSLAEVWDSRFFHNMTFAALYEREQRGESPRVILNGTSYNSGTRFALTTLPAADFEYDFIKRFLTDLRQRSDRVTPEGLAIIEENLESAKKHFLPLTFEQIGADHRQLRLSLAVASSASFPPVVGPVTYSVDGKPPYQHVGDGGLFDNLGTESLTTLFLKKIPRDSTKRGLIVVIDAAYPFDAGKPELDKNKEGFEVFKEDPSRIVGVMEERANAYQLMLWDALRTEGVVLPDFANLRIEILKHTEATWGGYQDLPAECRSEFSPNVTPEAINEAVSQIPTRLQITECHGALLIKAAQKVVEKHRERIVQFLEK
jgi:predicted acylesterase/phospholipase RssA